MDKYVEVYAASDITFAYLMKANLEAGALQFKSIMRICKTCIVLMAWHHGYLSLRLRWSRPSRFLQKFNKPLPMPRMLMRKRISSSEWNADRTKKPLQI